MAPVLPKEKTFDQIVKTLADHFEPRQLVIAERIRFHQRNQHPDKLVAEFVAELRRLIRDCEFKDHMDEVLRDWSVCGIQNEATQKRLCETPVLKVKGPSEKHLTVTLEIDGVHVPMEINTGAAMSLISEETQKHLFPKGSLRQPEVHLKTYTSESIPVVGVLRVQVKYQTYMGYHDLYVGGGNGPTLIGYSLSG